MKRFEYFITEGLGIDLEHPQRLVDVLNSYGSKGWELAHAIPVEELTDMYIFKRERA